MNTTPTGAAWRVWRQWDLEKLEEAERYYRKHENESIRSIALRFDPSDAFRQALRRRIKHYPILHPSTSSPLPVVSSAAAASSSASVSASVLSTHANPHNTRGRRVAIPEALMDEE